MQKRPRQPTLLIFLQISVLIFRQRIRFFYMNKLPIRPVSTGDIPAIKGIIESTGLFPAAYLDDMFSNSNEPEFWLTYDAGGPVAVAYVVDPEQHFGNGSGLSFAAKFAVPESGSKRESSLHSTRLALIRDSTRSSVYEVQHQPKNERCHIGTQ